MKKRVLISGIGGSLFPYLMNILEQKYTLFLIDSNETIKKLYPNKNIIIVPPAETKEYEPVIEELIEKEKIEYYIPLIDEELPKAFAISSRNTHLKLISPNKQFIELCRDKYFLMKELGEQNISKVKTLLASRFDFNLNWPIFLKPRTGRGSRGARKIENKKQFNAYFDIENYKKKDIIVQEYLDGIEYSVSVAVNNLNKLIAVVPKKIISKKGITQHAVTEKNELIEGICKDIIIKLKPCGPINIQLTVINGTIKIFEINPRFSTTSILSCEAGINEFELCIEHYNQKNIDYINTFKENLFLYRRWESTFYEKQ